MASIEHICTDPSHPLIIRNITQETLYKRISKRVTGRTKAGVTPEDLARQVSHELIPQLTKPSDCVEEGFRLQQMRQQIARDWREVFCKLDNLGHLTGWFMIDCLQDRNDDELHNELHFILCLLALDAIGNVFATVNQLRSALTDDTFVYLRTLHETFVKSRFLLTFSEKDPDLPGRFSYYNNTTYLNFYKKFAPAENDHDLDNSWIKAEQFYASRYQKMGKGDYGWTYPIIMTTGGKPKKRPTFRDLMDKVDSDSDFSRIYYDVSTSKSHGEFIWGLMTGPAKSGAISVDSFSVGNIGLVMDLMLPLFEEILDNTTSSCTKSEHAVVMDIVRDIVGNVRDSVASIKASDPGMHRGLEL